MRLTAACPVAHMPEAGLRTSSMPPINDLKSHLRLDPATGKLFWTRLKNNRCPVGSEAGTSLNGKRGYMTLGWDGKRYLTHRVIYYMSTGVDPGSSIVDHKNGDNKNNKPDNLRLATPSESSHNVRKSPVRNKSGVLGVHWNTQNNSWCAKLTVNGKQKCRFFKEFDDAVSEIGRLRKLHYGEFCGGDAQCG